MEPNIRKLNKSDSKRIQCGDSYNTELRRREPLAALQAMHKHFIT